MQPQGFEILYEEGPCLVVAKPAGLLTQAPTGVDSLETRVKRFIKERDEKPGKVYLAVCHRLDRPVSGALILAKHVRAAKRIGHQFEGRLVGKVYWAVVAGRVEPAEGCWKDHMRKIPDIAQSEIVESNHPDAKHAILNYQVLAQNDDASWLRIELETGRTHQIRLQAASRGHAIWGDAQYGSEVNFGPQTIDRRKRAIALHAESLSFHHPMNDQPVELQAPIPDYWRQEIPFAL